MKQHNKEYIGYPGGFEINRNSKKERETYREEWADQSERKEPIPLMIAEYQVGSERVWRAFVSDQRRAEFRLGFGEVYEIKQIKKKYKITAESAQCAECLGRGTVKKRECPNCNGVGYHTSHGEQVTKGTAVKVTRVERPTHPADATFYDEYV